MKNIFVYKNKMVDLNKVSAIEIDDNNQIIFLMDDDWEYTIAFDEFDKHSVTQKLLEKFTQ